MNYQILNLILLTIGFLTIIYSGEILHRKMNVNPEYTRKITHVLSSLSCLLFLFAFDSHWFVMIITSLFTLFLFISRKIKSLKSLDGVKRETCGSYVLPISVYITFYAYSYFKNPIFFILPMLILGISDPVAGLFGMWYKDKTSKIKLFNFTLEKTIYGSVAFFFTTFIISYSVLYFLNFSHIQLLLMSIVIAFTNTVAELLSSKGFDNLSIPLNTMLMLMIFI